MKAWLPKTCTRGVPQSQVWLLVAALAVVLLFSAVVQKTVTRADVAAPLVVWRGGIAAGQGSASEVQRGTALTRSQVSQLSNRSTGAVLSSSCPPTISIGVQSVSGLNVTVNGVVLPCTSSMTNLYVGWGWGDGVNTTAWFPTSHAYCSSGSYTITATAVQSDGETAGATTSVTVSGPDCPPAIALKNPVMSGLTLSVSGQDSSCAAGLNITEITWSWGDGTSSTTSGFPGVHTYGGVGTYLINATALRSDGATAESTERSSVTQGAHFLWQALGPQSSENRAPGTLCANAFGGLPFLPGAGKLQAFAMNASNPAVLYAGGGIGPSGSGPFSDAGLYKSVDGGRTWLPMDDGLSDRFVDELWIDPQNSNVVVAGTWTSGLFYSDTAAASWKLVYPTTEVTALALQGSTLYAATFGGVLESMNDGLNWSMFLATRASVSALGVGGGATYIGFLNGSVLAQLSPTAAWRYVLSVPGWTTQWIAVNPVNPDVAYVVEWNNYASPNLYFTKNGGASWSILPGINGPVQYVAIDPTNPSDVFVGVDGSLWNSSDGGQIFTQLPLGVDVRFIGVFSASRLVVGSDQGLFESTDAGRDWVGLNGDISTSLITGMAVSGSRIFTAVQDYSPIVSFNGGTTWSYAWSSTAPGGEDGTVAINPGNSSDVYVFTNAGLQISTDGGSFFLPSGAMGGTRLDGSYFTFQGANNLIGTDPRSPNLVYLATSKGIYKSTDWGVSFAATLWPFSSASLVVDAPDQSQKIFVGTQDGLFYTTDGGSSWSHDVLPRGAGTPTALAFDPVNTSVILVGTTVVYSGGIFRSTDGGASFSPTNNGLPTTPTPAFWWEANGLAFEPNTPIVSVATTVGLFLSTNLGTNWSSISGNVIPDWFTDLQWSGGFLYTSTYGEGVLRLPFPSEVTSFSAVPAELDVGSTTTFIVIAVGGSGALTYSYSGLPLGCASTNVSRLSCTPQVSGAFGVTVTVMDSVGHAASAETTIQVNPLPAVSSFAPTPATVSVGSATILTVDVKGGTPPLSYLYSHLPPACETANTSTLSCTPSVPGVFQIGVKVTDQDGRGASATTTLTVYAIFPVMFAETGLPSGTSWSVTLGGVPHTSGTSTITFSEPNGTYAYSVGSASGYTASPSSGSVTVNGAGVSTSIAFTAVPPPKYDVTFTETSLPAGTSWSVTLAGTTHTSTASTIAFSEPNGTYSYTVGAVAGYTANTASGTITVNGQAVSKAITFSATSGGPTISSFVVSASTITVGSSATFTATASGGTAPLTYAYTGLPSGCSSANTSALTCTPTATGSFTVTVTVTDSAGRTTTATVSLTINPQPSGGPSTNRILGLPAAQAYAIFAAIAIAIVVGGTVAVVRSRRKRMMRPPSPPR